MPSIVFRPSKGHDAQVVFDITNRSVSGLALRHYPKQVIETWMVGRSAETYRADCEAASLVIAEVEGRAAGFVHAVPGEVVRLFVDVAYSGLGLGAELM